MNKDNTVGRIDILVTELNAASDAYYNGHEEIMSNFEWDMKFDELKALEQETGYIRPDSPTQTAGIEAVKGQKETHEFAALSLAKSKNVSDLQQWAEQRPIWLSWKLDGLTLVLTYDNGMLTKILTRGNGTVGTNITFLKDAIGGFPQKIAYKGHMVVRGEAAISYTDFEIINDTIEDDEKYANPRNLASGTLNLDDPAKVKARHVHFHAFTLVHMDEDIVSWGARMDYLESLGFTVVDREQTDAAGLPAVIEAWTHRVESGQMDIPVDGLVICYDDTEYASTGSVTGHHATRAGLAFKWQDEAVETKLDHIKWSCAAYAITPVAVFEPVEIEGTTVRKASLCNLSEMERLGIKNDSILSVIKANKIIPKVIASTGGTTTPAAPKHCPVCGANTEIRMGKNGSKTLRCTNPECAAKNLKRFVRFADKKSMDIEGLSEQTLSLLIREGFIKNLSDIYRLPSHKEELVRLEGMGEKSCQNLFRAIEKSRDADPVNFLHALGIPTFGTDAAKIVIREIGFDRFLDRMLDKRGLQDLEGIGPERSFQVLNWFNDQANCNEVAELLAYVHLKYDKAEVAAPDAGCQGLTFVITGDVHSFPNRSAFKAYVESKGGKVAGSVSSKTSFLVSNDTSSSSKYRKAVELNVPVITEDEFMQRFGQ